MKLTKLATIIKEEIIHRFNPPPPSSFVYSLSSSLPSPNFSIAKSMMLGALLVGAPQLASAVTVAECNVTAGCVVVTNTAQLNTALNNTGTATRVVLANDITLNTDVQVRMIESGRRDIVIDGNGFSLNTGVFDFNIAGNTDTVWAGAKGSFKFENINELTSSTAGDQSVIFVGQQTAVNVVFDNIKRFTNSMYAVMGQLGDNANGNRMAEVVFGNIDTMDKFTYGVGHQIVQGGPLRFTGDFAVFTDGTPGTYNTIFWSNTPNQFNIMNFESTANVSAQVTKFTLGSSANNDAYQYIMADGARFQLYTPQNVFGAVNNGLKLGTYDLSTGFGSGVQLDLADFNGNAVVGHGISNLGGDAAGGMGNGASTAGDVIFNVGSGSTLRYSGANNAGIFVQKNTGITGNVFVRSDAVLNATNANGIAINMNGTGELVLLNDVNAVINAQKGISVVSSGIGSEFDISNYGVINSTVDGIAVNSTQVRTATLLMAGGKINAQSGNAISISGQTVANISGGTIDLSTGAIGLNLTTNGQTLVSEMEIASHSSSSKTIVKSAGAALTLSKSRINVDGSAEGLAGLTNLVIDDLSINVAGMAKGIDTRSASLDTWQITDLDINVKETGTGLIVGSGQNINKDISIAVEANSVAKGISILDGAAETTILGPSLQLKAEGATAVDIAGTQNKNLILDTDIVGNVTVSNSGQTGIEINQDFTGDINLTAGTVHSINVNEVSSFDGNINFLTGQNTVTLDAGSQTSGTINGSSQVDTIVVASDAQSNLSLSLGEGNNSVTLGERSELLGQLSTGAGNDTLLLGADASMSGAVNLGSGNNQITLADGARLNNTLTTGIGNDSLILNRNALIAANIDLGNGDNTVQIQDQVTLAGTLSMGTGNDTLTFSGINSVAFMQIDAGTGNNTVNLTNDSNLLLTTPDQLRNFTAATVSNNSSLSLGSLNGLSGALISIDDLSSVRLLQGADGNLNNQIAGTGTVLVDSRISLLNTNEVFAGKWVINSGAQLNTGLALAFGNANSSRVENNGVLGLDAVNNFNYQLLGDGQLNINHNSSLGVISDFVFGSQVGNAFTGTVNLLNTRMDLSNLTNQLTLSQTNLVLGSNSFGLVSDNSRIGDLRLGGGELDFVFSSPTIAPVLEVNYLDLGVGTLSRIDLAGNVNLDTSSIPSGVLPGNFLDQDSDIGNNGILLVQANTLSEEGKQISLTVNGGATGTSVQFTNVSDGVNNDITAIYDYLAISSDTNNATRPTGIYVDYVLKELVSASNILFSNEDSVSNSLDLLVSGVGGIEIKAKQGTPISITNPANSYQGVTKLTQGELKLGGDNVLGNTAELSLATMTRVDVNAKTLSVGGLTGSGELAINGGSISLTNGSLSQVFTGVLSGTSGNLTIAGGHLQLSGVQNFTGNTQVQTGALLTIGGVAQANTIAYAGDILNNGQVTFSGTASQRYEGVISGLGNVLVAPGGLVLTKAQTFVGDTIIQSQLSLTQEADLIGNVRLADSSAKLIINKTGAFVFDNLIAENGGVVLSGVGAVSLTNTNTYLGNTEVQSGRLILTNAQAAGSGQVINNAILDLDFDNQQIANTWSGSGQVNILGSGQSFAPSVNDNSGFSGVLNIADTYSLSATALSQFGSARIQLNGVLDYTSTQATNFAFDLNGAGVLNVDLSGAAWQFTNGTPNAYTGKLVLRNTSMDLDVPTNRSSLNTATLSLGEGAVVTSTNDGSMIGNLAFEGGRLDVAMVDATNAKFLKVKELSVVSGKLNLTGVALGTPGGIQGRSLLEQNTLDLASGFIAVRADTVLTPGAYLDLFVDGTPTSPQTVEITDDRGNTINATYKYISVAADSSIAQALIDSGLYVTYQLIKMESLGNLVIEARNSEFDLLTAQLTGAGAISFSAGPDVPITVQNTQNNYTGETTIDTGTVALGDSNGLGQTSNLVLNLGTSFNLNGFAQTIGGISGEGTLGINGGMLTLAGTNTTFDGVISGATGTFTINSALTLTGASDFTGQTNLVSGVTLSIGNGGVGATYVGAINNAGTVVFNHSDDKQYDAIITGTGSLVKEGVGTLTITNDQTFSGGTQISAGTLQLDNGGSLTGPIVNDAVLSVNHNDEFVLNNLISGTGKLVHRGQGLLILDNADNSFSGGVDISTLARLRLLRNTAAGTGAISNSGALELSYDDANFTSQLVGTGSTLVHGQAITLAGDSSAYLGDWQITGSAIINSDNTSLVLGNTAVKLDGSLTINAQAATNLALSNTFSGQGLLDVYGVIGAAGPTTLDFTADQAQNFRGTVGLNNAQLTLSSDNTAVLRTATLQLNTGSNLINNTYKAIGSLTLNGGQLSTGLASRSEAYLLTVNNLNLGSVASRGLLDIGAIDLSTLGMNKDIVGASFLDMAVADGDAIQLISAQNISQEGVMLKLLLDGQSVSSTQLLNQQDGFGNADIIAEYNFTGVTSRSAGVNGTAGLFLDYLLTSLTTNSSLVISTENSTNKTLGVLIKGQGSLELRGDSGTLTVANSNNSYEGNTFITSGTVRLGADQSLSNLSLLVVRDQSQFDLAGYTQDLNRITIEQGSQINLNGGTLNYLGGALSQASEILDTGINGELTGTGKINIQDGVITINSINKNLNADIHLLGTATLVLSQSSQLGYGSLTIDSSAKLNLSNALALVDNNLLGTGQVNLINSDVTLTGNSQSFSGLFNVEQKSRLTVTDVSNLGTAAVNNQGSLEFNLAKNKDQELRTVISGLGDINKSGEGTLRIKSAYDTVGTFKVKQGYLVLDSENASIASLTIANGAFAGGVGQIKGNVLNEGVLYVGDALQKTGQSSRTLTIEGDLHNFNTISLAGVTPGNVLNVKGNYEAHSDLIVNAVLEGDDSLIDKLNIAGSTSGNTQVLVNNLGGKGAQTEKGIELVTVGGSSDGTFSLASRVVAGSYDYQLVRSGNNWVLQSNLLAIRPEIAAYLANIDIANASMSMRYQDRASSAFVSKSQGQAVFSDDKRIWARVLGNVTDNLAANEINQRLYQTSFEFGSELFGAYGMPNKSSYSIGILGALGRSHSSSTNPISNFVANTNQDSYRVGVYGTYLFDSASTHEQSYLDTWIQYGWYSNEVRGQDLKGKESYDATNLALSFELGYPVNLQNTERSYLDIVPQLQVTYKHHSADSFVEANGTAIRHPDRESIESRLGAQLNYQYQAKNNLRMKVYLGANWIHNNTQSSVELNGSSYYSNKPKDVFDINLGFSAERNSNLSMFVELGAQHGKQGYKDISGSFGLRYRF